VDGTTDGDDMKGSPEAMVVMALKRHLLRHGVLGALPSSILVDADPSFLRSSHARDLEPMARFPIEGLRPDLICAIPRSSGSLLAAFEVKASSTSWLKGLAQAEHYMQGVNMAYLALPGAPTELERLVGKKAEARGIGLWGLHRDAWIELVPPRDPTPKPLHVQRLLSALGGVPLGRQLQLNHPLNYLVIPYFARLAPGEALLDTLARDWPDLGTPGTRIHAITGATTLGLITQDRQPTFLGRIVADLLVGLSFRPETRPNKRVRLVDAHPALAAVARFVLAQQPAVAMILEALQKAKVPLVLPELAMSVEKTDPDLASALFLRNPSIEVQPGLAEEDYNPSTVFKLKQNLWHAGLLRSKCHPLAGKAGAVFPPSEDIWELDV